MARTKKIIFIYISSEKKIMRVVCILALSDLKKNLAADCVWLRYIAPAIKRDSRND